jgi:hypothetical protein
MFKNIKASTFLFILLSFLHLNVGSQSFGIRAGLNYNKFNGPLEAGEKFTITSGFHFGVNYAYKLTDLIALKGELLYTQVGSGYEFAGQSFYKVPLTSNNNTLIPNAYIYEKGISTLNMKISNAYISIPLVLEFKIDKNWELNAGVYGSVLIGPRGNGTLRFTSTENPKGIYFKQSLVHNYNKDTAGSSTGQSGSVLIVNDKKVPIARNAGAYYNYLSTELEGKLYNLFDFGLTGGISYFINKGLFVGVRYDLGLVDITNNKVDASRISFDETNNRFDFRSDRDMNYGFQATFGFKF